MLKIIWYVLASGCRWEDVPPEMGCSGRTVHRRLQLWERLGVWDHLHADLLRLLLELLVENFRTDRNSREFRYLLVDRPSYPLNRWHKPV